MSHETPLEITTALRAYAAMDAFRDRATFERAADLVEAASPPAAHHETLRNPMWAEAVQWLQSEAGPACLDYEDGDKVGVCKHCRLYRYLHRPAVLLEYLAAASPPAADTGRLIVEELEKLRDKWRQRAAARQAASWDRVDERAEVYEVCADELQELRARVSGQPVGEK